ncbi:unnamed protein product [Polarella glacialis]|uniref:Uncharacterized protein n=1 Tax=Polarella glacialis TaxID=89957 RepID=A0A813GRP7_POLGL|nr:unnamed protein product [Polarella glacialis]
MARQEISRYIGSYLGGEATIIEQAPNADPSTEKLSNKVWHSQIVMGSASLNAEAWARWPTTGQDGLSMSLQSWKGLQTPSGGQWSRLCMEETYVAVNNTLIRYIVTGPEDPKALVHNASLMVTFDSLPPSEGHQLSCRHDALGLGDAVAQMYLAIGVKGTEPFAPVTGYRLGYGKQGGDEKNWVPFTSGDALYFVYSPLPHVILEAQSDGSCAKKYSTSFRPLQRLVKENPHIKVRGSGQAVLIDDPAATPSLPQAHFLALLHLFDFSSGRYRHFAYRFGASPPFMMLQMSSQLPLTEAEAKPGGVPFAFASGLVVQNRTVAISYGAGDRDARALVLTLGRLDEMFNCSNHAA